jgi:hypothetical protein
MKSRVLIFAALCSTPVAFAQQATTVQLECHDPASTGNVLASDETLVNGLACHPVKQANPQKQSSPSQVPAAANGSAQAFVATSGTASGTTATSTQPAISAPVNPATPAGLKIVEGSRVYISPMDGFETYLAAALGKKKVPLVAIADQSQANYVITGNSLDKKAGRAKIVFMGSIHSDNAASITMTDRRTGAIVYAYAVDKKSTMHGQQTTAEACAKHLKAHIEGRE